MHHIIEKGFQLGSVVGVAVVLPIAAYRQRKHTGALAGKDLLRLLGKSALVGTGVATAMGLARIASLPADERPDGLQDRAYRLHYNQSQNRVDFMSEIGMAVGGTVALWVSPAAAVVLGGAAAGAAVGVAAHVATWHTPKEA